MQATARFSAKDGQSIGVVIFESVPHNRVFLAGENEEGGFLTTSYATHTASLKARGPASAAS